MVFKLYNYRGKTRFWPNPNDIYLVKNLISYKFINTIEFETDPINVWLEYVSSIQ